METVAQKAMDHAVLFLIGQFILFILTLVGALAVGKRFINQEYPAFAQRVEMGMSAMKSEMQAQISSVKSEVSSVKSELLTEMNDLRRDLLGYREQFIRHEIDYAKQTTGMSYLDRRVARLENRFENDDTKSFRRKTDDVG